MLPSAMESGRVGFWVHIQHMRKLWRTSSAARNWQLSLIRSRSFIGLEPRDLSDALKCRLASLECETMFYLIGTHSQFGNVIYTETCVVNGQFYIRPTTCALHMEAFDMMQIERMRALMQHTHPAYKWIPIGADSS